MSFSSFPQLMVAPKLENVSAPTKDNLEIIFYRDSKVDDGRYANNGWMQELPDPVTKMTWDNAVLISRKTARELGVQSGDLVEIALNGRKVTVPSIAVRVGDVIGVRPGSDKSKIFDGLKEKLANVELPAWLTFDADTLTGKVTAMPKAAEAAPLFDTKQIIELYSR